MKKNGSLSLIILLCLSAFSMADTRDRMNVSVGDEIYVCNMGETCPCDTMAMKPGNCKCGKELIKTRVTKVEDDTIFVESRGKGFKRTGKYACACREACDCGTIAQKPGKCICGHEMKEVRGDQQQ